MTRDDARRMRAPHVDRYWREHGHECADCKNAATCPMLEDEVWEPIAPAKNEHGHSLLCLHCAEKRLGRPIVLADLAPCVGNYATYAMVRRALGFVGE